MTRQAEWTEERVRRLYAMRAAGTPTQEIASALRCNRATIELFCTNHFLSPVSEAAPLAEVLEIFRQSRGGTPRMTDAEEARLRALWIEPGATLRSVGLALKWKRDRLLHRALSLRLGPVGDLLPDTPAARAALDLCHPRETRKLDTVCRAHKAAAAEVLGMVKRIAPKHDAIMKYDQTRRAEASGPPLPDKAIHAKRLEVLRDRALKLAGAGVTCAHSLARELDPLGEHRLTPAQAATLAGLETVGGAHA